MFERDVELQRFAIALDLEWHVIACEGMGREQICKFNFTVERIDIVAVLIDPVVANFCHDVAHLQAGLHCRHVRFHTRHINSTRLSSLTGESTQLWIARREKRKTGRRKPPYFSVPASFKKCVMMGAGMASTS